MFRHFIALIGIVFLSTVPTIAWAACASPTGAEGDVIYNTDHKVVQYCDGTNWIGMAGGSGGGGGGGAPGGADTQIQFNDGGAFAGDADMTWDKTGNLLDIAGSIAINRVSVKAYTGLAAPTGGSTAQWDTNGTDVWRASGKVGIGTGSPGAKLEIGGTSGVDGIKFPDATTQTTAFNVGAITTATAEANSTLTGTSTSWSAKQYATCATGYSLAFWSLTKNYALVGSTGSYYHYCLVGKENATQAYVMILDNQNNANYICGVTAFCVKD